MVDYRIDVQNPFMSALEGFQTAQQMQAMRAQAEQVRAAQQRKVEMQTALGQFAARERTPEEYQRMMQLFPEIADQVKVSLQALNDQQRKNKINQLLPVFAALKSNNVVVAKQQLDENIAAARNSGKENEARMMEQIKSNLDMGPEGIKGAATSAGLFLYEADPAKFKTIMEAMKIQGEEARATELQPGEIKKQQAELIKSGVDAGLTEQQALKTAAETKKLGVDTQKTLMEMAALEKQGGIPKEKLFDLEMNMRKDITSRTKNYWEAVDANSKLQTAAQDSSGAGDIALVYSFMKMLDPGSVVRETEFATAARVSGLLQELKNKAKKLKSGEFLSPAERKKYAQLSSQFMQSTEKLRNRIIKEYDPAIKNYGLNKENIIGAEPQAETPPQQQTTEAQQKKEIVQTGTFQGRKVVKYSDGSIEYAD